jgi:arrestin-related trafficking adapter 3/6
VRARFSFASVSSSILEAMRSVQGTHGDRGHLRHGGESRDEDHSFPPPVPLSHVEEAVILDGNEQGSDCSGDGWQEFNKGMHVFLDVPRLVLIDSDRPVGTYTFPISFAIPSHVPPTLECTYGSVCWRLKATVHRPGAFTPKLSATREVTLVASPSEDHRDDTDNAIIERCWEDQLQYILSVSGRVFPLGGTVPITLTLLPMAKVKVFKVLVQLEGNVIYPIRLNIITQVNRTGGLLLRLFAIGTPQGPGSAVQASLTCIQGRRHPTSPAPADSNSRNRVYASFSSQIR